MGFCFDRHSIHRGHANRKPGGHDPEGDRSPQGRRHHCQRRHQVCVVSAAALSSNLPHASLWQEDGQVVEALWDLEAASEPPRTQLPDKGPGAGGHGSGGEEHCGALTCSRVCGQTPELSPQRCINSRRKPQSKQMTEEGEAGCERRGDARRGGPWHGAGASVRGGWSSRGGGARRVCSHRCDQVCTLCVGRVRRACA
eukprot:1281859-Rhodomonas_salina.2